MNRSFHPLGVMDLPQHKQHLKFSILLTEKNDKYNQLIEALLQKRPESQPPCRTKSWG